MHGPSPSYKVSYMSSSVFSGRPISDKGNVNKDKILSVSRNILSEKKGIDVSCLLNILETLVQNISVHSI